MTNNPELQRFREITWRRPLTAAEQAELDACLKANSAAREEWGAEMALVTAMDSLADPRVSSNFTARVLQAIEREDRAVTRAGYPDSWWRRLAHRAAWAWSASAAAVLAIGGLLLHQHQVERHLLAKQELEKSVVLAKAVLAVPNAEVLANFDAIRALSTSPGPDEKLLAALAVSE